MKKKSLIAAIILMVALSFCSTSFAKTEETDGGYIKGRFYLETFGIDTAEFEGDTPVTRGFVANVVSKTLFDELVITPAMTNFADVPPDSECASAAYLLSNHKIMQGDGVYFSPNENVTYGQIAKIFISSLGADVIAQEKGGYPAGYVAVANTNGIFGGITRGYNEVVTFSDFAKMYYNFVACKGCVRSGENFGTYTMDNVTVLERKLSRCDMRYVEGVVTGNQFGSFENDVLGKISIENMSYNLGCEIEEEFIGYYADAFVKKINGRYAIVSIIKDPFRNEVKSLKESDIADISLEKIEYYDGDRVKTITLSNVFVVRNGKILSSYTDEDITPLNGDILLIDNDYDNQYEYIHIENKQYYTIERISLENNVVILKDGNYEGSTHIYINPDDEQYYHRIYTADGEIGNFGDISVDDVIRIEGSPEQKLLRVYIIDEVFQGKLEGFMPNEIFPVKINGESYRAAKNTTHNDIVDLMGISFNKIYDFTIDGSLIIKAEELENDTLTYAYVIDTRTTHTFSPKISYKLVSEDKQVYVGELAEKIRYNGENVYLEDFTPKSGVVISYRIDNDGKICEINDAELHSAKANKIYKKETGILYSQTYQYPLFMSENTVVFIVPDSKEDEDYMADISLVDGYTYRCEAYDYNDEDSSISVLVIYDDVYYESPGYIYAESPVCILKEITGVIDEDGHPVKQLTWLEGQEEKIATVKDTVNMNNIVNKMAVGDVFQYSLTTRGVIDNISTLVRLDQNPEYFHTGAYSKVEMVYGKVVDAEYKTLPKGYVAKFVNIFNIDVNDGTVKSFLVTSAEEAVSYYIYDSELNKVRVSSFDDILSEDGVLGTFNASEVFIYYYGAPSEAKAVVIKS